MQSDPKQYFKQNGIYVIIERNPDMIVPGHVRVIGVTTSYEDAVKYAGPNTIIEGPVSVLGQTDFYQQPIKVSYPMFKKDFEPIFKPPILIEKNPFEQVRPVERNPFRLPNINPFDTPMKNPFEPTKPIDINPFRLQKPQNDFSMLTPPSSRVGSNASSPASDQYY